MTMSNCIIDVIKGKLEVLAAGLMATGEVWELNRVFPLTWPAMTKLMPTLKQHSEVSQSSLCLTWMCQFTSLRAIVWGCLQTEADNPKPGTLVSHFQSYLHNREGKQHDSPHPTPLPQEKMRFCSTFPSSQNTRVAGNSDLQKTKCVRWWQGCSQNAGLSACSS